MAAGEEGEQDVVEVGVAASSIGDSGDKKEVTRKQRHASGGGEKMWMRA